jgi:hypothetical protein
MISIHKELNYALASAEGLCEVGHGDIALVELEQAIEHYDEVVTTTGVNRHYPTYANVTSFLFSLQRDLA